VGGRCNQIEATNPVIMQRNDYNKKRRLLSEKLIEAREQAGLSQKQVSEKKIVSQSELSKIENGTRRVDFIILLELSTFYNQPISFFIPENESVK
jgi:transcriptional regulator with XRE-family HTH domain